MYIRSPFAGEYHRDGLKLTCDLHDYEAKSLNNSQ